MKQTRRTYAMWSVVAFAALQLVTSTAWTKVEYDTNQLKMLDADQVSEVVRKKIDKAHKAQAKQPDDSTMVAMPESIVALKDGMRIILSRPDQDGARSNLYGRLRRELIDLNSYDQTMQELADEGIKGLKLSKTAPRRQMTYLVLLENLMAEIQPEIGDNKILRGVVEKIRDAGLKVSEQAKGQALLRSMAVPISPSETAAKILPKSKAEKSSN